LSGVFGGDPYFSSIADYATNNPGVIRNIGTGISVGTFVVGVGIDLHDGKIIGVVLAHNGGGLATSKLASLGVLAAGGPVGLAVGAAILAGIAYDAAYNSNFLGFRNCVDSVGYAIDDAFKYIRNNVSIQREWKAYNFSSTYWLSTNDY